MHAVFIFEVESSKVQLLRRVSFTCLLHVTYATRSICSIYLYYESRANMFRSMV